MSDTETHDVFSDESKTIGEADIGTETNEPVNDKEAETNVEAQPGAKDEEQQGEQQAAEPPAADGDNKVSQAEKMIPESRLKAAIKDVSDKLTEAQRELATMKAKPAPDRAQDPDGYDRHVRIETSKAIMQETVSDYDEKIAHFQKMAQTEPSLNAIVANHKAPAKMAYDLAKKDMEITELYKLKDDPSMVEFKAWKAAKEAAATTTDTAQQLSGKTPAAAAAKVPNLNRNSPSVNRDLGKQGDDNLFQGHYSSTGF